MLWFVLPSECSINTSRETSRLWAEMIPISSNPRTARVVCPCNRQRCLYQTEEYVDTRAGTWRDTLKLSVGGDATRARHSLPVTTPRQGREWDGAKFRDGTTTARRTGNFYFSSWNRRDIKRRPSFRNSFRHQKLWWWRRVDVSLFIIAHNPPVGGRGHEKRKCVDCGTFPFLLWFRRSFLTTPKNIFKKKEVTVSWIVHGSATKFFLLFLVSRRCVFFMGHATWNWQAVGRSVMHRRLRCAGKTRPDSCQTFRGTRRGGNDNCRGLHWHSHI